MLNDLADRAWQRKRALVMLSIGAGLATLMHYNPHLATVLAGPAGVVALILSLFRRG